MGVSSPKDGKSQISIHQLFCKVLFLKVIFKNAMHFTADDGGVSAIEENMVHQTETTLIWNNHHHQTKGPTSQSACLMHLFNPPKKCMLN